MQRNNSRYSENHHYASKSQPVASISIIMEAEQIHRFI